MVWFRRLLALALVLLAVGGYAYVRQHRRAAAQAERAHLALLTARIWVGTAEYRDRPAVFLAWRDSLLAAENLTSDSLRVRVDRLRADPSASGDYFRQVSRFVDSLVRIRTAPAETSAGSAPPPGVRVRRE